MAAGVNYSNNNRSIRLDKVIDRQVAFGDKCPAIVIELHRKTPRLSAMVSVVEKYRSKNRSPAPLTRTSK
jgi:hypothetical protein